MDILALKERILKTLELHESQFREFKSAYEGQPNNKVRRHIKDVSKDISETLVAFANADGGELLVGVEDDGSITGHDYPTSQVEKLLAAPITGVHKDTPLAAPIAQRVQMEDKELLYFSVEKSTTNIHQTADGRCLQRNDRETRPVSAKRLQFERHEQISREYDRHYANNAQVRDLDLNLVSNVSQATSHMTSEKCLQYLGLADFGMGVLRLRNAALLLFAKDISLWHPRCQVRIVRVRGMEMLTGRDLNIASDEVVNGNIIKLLTTAWERLRPHLVQTRLSVDSLFREQVMYPEDACREALINAITHRDYSIEGQNIEVIIYDDRMEVHSPGTLLSTINLVELRKLTGTHESRNALIARVLREVGYVREMGEGMRRIFNLFSDADLIPPELISSDSKFSIILHYKSVFSAEDQHWLAGYKRLNLTRDEMLICLLGKDGQLIAPIQIYDLLNLVDWDIYRELVEQMYSKGVMYNTLTEAQKNTISKKKGTSKREIARLAIRQPDIVEKDLSELLHEITFTNLNELKEGKWANSIINTLPENNIYKSNAPKIYRLFRILNLIDDENKPTSLLISLLPSKVDPNARASVKEQKHEPKISARSSERVRIGAASTKSPSDGKTGLPIDIYVGNLTSDTTDRQVFNVFQSVGQVINVYLPKDLSTSKGRGFGFVKMSNRQDAKKALDTLNCTVINGNRIRLTWAR